MITVTEEQIFDMYIQLGMDFVHKWAICDKKGFLLGKKAIQKALSELGPRKLKVQTLLDMYSEMDEAKREDWKGKFSQKFRELVSYYIEETLNRNKLEVQLASCFLGLCSENVWRDMTDELFEYFLR